MGLWSAISVQVVVVVMVTVAAVVRGRGAVGCGQFSQVGSGSQPKLIASGQRNVGAAWGVGFPGDFLPPCRGEQHSARGIRRQARHSNPCGLTALFTALFTALKSPSLHCYTLSSSALCTLLYVAWWCEGVQVDHVLALDAAAERPADTSSHCDL